MPGVVLSDWLLLLARHPLYIVGLSLFAVFAGKLVYDQAPFWAAYPPLKRGEYDLALGRLAMLERINKGVALYFLKGSGYSHCRGCPKPRRDHRERSHLE